MLNAAVAVALLFSACAAAVPLGRAANVEVIRSCTVPNTVALTFVRVPTLFQGVVF